MSAAKAVKKSLSFSTDEQDQQLLTYVDQALDNNKYASFSELVKTALHHLFTGANGVAETAQEVAAKTEASTASQTAEQLQGIEALLQTLVAGLEAQQPPATLESQIATANAQTVDRLQGIEAQLDKLVAAQDALAATLAEQHQAADTDKTPSPAEDEAIMAAIEERLAAMQAAQQELYQALQQQGETLLAELHKLPLASVVEQPAAEQTAASDTAGQGDGSLAHLSRFLEDF